MSPDVVPPGDLRALVEVTVGGPLAWHRWRERPAEAVDGSN
jgi:hypothetical protein